MAGGITSFLKLPSQPGGVSNQSIRFLADFDMRLPGQGGPAQPNNSPMYRAFSTFPGNSSFSDDITRAPGDTDPLRWGPAVSDALGQPKVVLFDVPRLPAGSPAGWPAIVSLGQLQHAHIGTRPWHPSYIIGNSYASLFTQRDKTISLQTVPSGWIRDDKFYDLSYLLNESLWDHYYFSSVPQPPAVFAPATDLLANRYLPIVSDAGIPLTQAALTQNAFSAAANLLVNGAFNVNSTSDQAWRAVFATFRGLDQNGETNLSGPFLRTPHQTGASSTSNTGTSSNAWSGFRNLSDSEIADLAREMVKQVRLRGPFRSLADFVNRRLMDPATDPNQLGLRGALQAAIDAAGINGNFPNANNSTETSYTSLPAYSQMHPNNAVGNRATGAPGWLMQADLLQALAPVLTARSDTFVIRAYGEALSPDGLTVLAKSWCEAVVQRLPEFIDPLNPPDALVTALNPTNQMFGRRFKIIQFRWLNANEI
jgi:hypothetical protein